MKHTFWTTTSIKRGRVGGGEVYTELLTLWPKRLQRVRDKHISFHKIVAHVQLSNLIINDINYVAMVTTVSFQKSKMAAISSSFEFYISILNLIIFLKQLQVITNMTV